MRRSCRRRRAPSRRRRARRLRRRACDAEKRQCARRAASRGSVAALGRVHDRGVARLLVAEDAVLRRGVRVEVRIAIHVIGRDVQQQRDVRAERVDGLELERRELEHVRARPLEIDGGDQRLADVAGDDRLPSGDFEDLADERGRRRLAVRAGDRR